MSRLKLLISPTNISSTICRRPGTGFRFRVSRMAARVRAAMMIHDTTTDWDTGMPPKTGMVKATGFSSWAVNSALTSSKSHPSSPG